MDFLKVGQILDHPESSCAWAEGPIPVWRFLFINQQAFKQKWLESNRDEGSPEQIGDDMVVKRRALKFTSWVILGRLFTSNRAFLILNQEVKVIMTPTT